MNNKADITRRECVTAFAATASIVKGSAVKLVAADGATIVDQVAAVAATTDAFVAVTLAGATAGEFVPIAFRGFGGTFQALVGIGVTPGSMLFPAAGGHFVTQSLLMVMTASGGAESRAYPAGYAVALGTAASGSLVEACFV